MNAGLILYCFLIFSSCSRITPGTDPVNDDRFVWKRWYPGNEEIRFFHRNNKGEPYRNIGSLIKQLGDSGENMVFAMNGGMYLKDMSPQGLYVENGREIQALDTRDSGYGNFYLQPNGVFFIDENGKAGIGITRHFARRNLRYATQSGPMLLYRYELNSHFIKDSKNLHIRNGIGIYPDGSLLFAMSKQEINFYDFAYYFKKAGCIDALYLDGFVSRTYHPNRDWKQPEGNFAVIIAVFRKD